jgi:hypothetical protein
MLKESKRSVREYTSKTFFCLDSLVGDGDVYKVGINESENIDLNKSQKKTNLTYSDARNMMAIDINEKDSTNQTPRAPINNKPPPKKKKAGYGCGPNSKCDIF